MIEFINNQREKPLQSWPYRAVQYASATWQSPTLPVPINPARHDLPGRSTTQFHRATCP